MEAMDPACCQWFAGPDHTLEDFHQLIKRLIMRKDSQYSYRNTLVAVTDSGEVEAALHRRSPGNLRPGLFEHERRDRSR